MLCTVFGGVFSAKSQFGAKCDPLEVEPPLFGARSDEAWNRQL